MKRLLGTPALVTLLMVAAGAQPLAAQDPEGGASREQVAQRAAEAWLRLIAEGEYEAGWQQAGSLFQQQVTAEQWSQQGASVTGQLGALESRELQNAQYTTELPQVPAGEYIVLTYASAFANLPNAREVVITALEDGEWKVVGYFVQPAQGP